MLTESTEKVMCRVCRVVYSPDLMWCPACFPGNTNPEGLSPDELEVLEFVKEGVRTGRKVYGPLEVSSDPRDFLYEAEQELRDSIVYMVAKIQQLRKMRERLGEITL